MSGGLLSRGSGDFRAASSRQSDTTRTGDRLTQTAGPDDVSAQGGARNMGSAEEATGNPESQYVAALKEYTRTHSEASLYEASLLSHQFVRGGLGPEDIIALHAGALDLATEGLSFREQARASTDALHFL